MRYRITTTDFSEANFDYCTCAEETYDDNEWGTCSACESGYYDETFNQKTYEVEERTTAQTPHEEVKLILDWFIDHQHQTPCTWAGRDWAEQNKHPNNTMGYMSKSGDFLWFSHYSYESENVLGTENDYDNAPAILETPTGIKLNVEEVSSNG